MKQSMLINGGILAAFAVVTTGLIGLTHSGTESTIEDQHRQKVENILNAIIPPALYDNNILNDCTFVSAPDALGTAAPAQIYRGRKRGKPAAMAIETTAPNGYAGKIQLIVGIDEKADVTGVRVLEHKETPGLGDKIDLRVSDWILSFNGKTVTEDNLHLWAVRKDGGQFDQFTGATITPRAVVNAVQSTVTYFKENKQMLFEAPNQCAPRMDTHPSPTVDTHPSPGDSADTHPSRTPTSVKSALSKEKPHE